MHKIIKQIMFWSSSATKMPINFVKRIIFDNVEACCYSVEFLYFNFGMRHKQKSENIRTMFNISFDFGREY